MALPQQVLERLTEEPQKTPGWPTGLLSFTGGILAIALAVYCGIVFAYEPYLNAKISGMNDELAATSKAVSSADQGALITLYSQTANLQSVLAGHVLFSRFFTWLEKNTEANVWFSRLSFSSGNQITLVGNAKTEADANQQLAIFEASPDVASVAISGVDLSPQTNSWQFTMNLTMNNIDTLSP